MTAGGIRCQCAAWCTDQYCMAWPSPTRSNSWWRVCYSPTRFSFHYFNHFIKNLSRSQISVIGCAGQYTYWRTELLGRYWNFIVGTFHEFELKYSAALCFITSLLLAVLLVLWFLELLVPCVHRHVDLLGDAFVGTGLLIIPKSVRNTYILVLQSLWSFLWSLKSLLYFLRLESHPWNWLHLIIVTTKMDFQFILYFT